MSGRINFMLTKAFFTAVCGQYGEKNNAGQGKIGRPGAEMLNLNRLLKPKCKWEITVRGVFCRIRVGRLYLPGATFWLLDFTFKILTLKRHGGEVNKKTRYFIEIARLVWLLLLLLVAVFQPVFGFFNRF
jgi:hypothetical protein